MAVTSYEEPQEQNTIVEDNQEEELIDIDSILDANEKDITLEELKNNIYSSDKLSNNDKDLIYNEEYLNTILPYINTNSYLKYKLRERTTDLNVLKEDIEPYSHYGTTGNVSGYYNPDEPNEIHIQDYLNGQNEYNTVLTHEFVHLTQENYQYDLIQEGCAELLSSEFNDHKETTYIDEVKIVRKLMEIVDPNLVLQYTITGNFLPIEKELKQYMSEESYEALIYCIGEGFEMYEGFITTILDGILNQAYENKYQESANESEVLKALDSDTLVRYYFNPKLNNSESYYMSYENANEIKYSTEDAINIGLIAVTAISEIEYSEEQAQNLRSQGIDVYELIDYDKDNPLSGYSMHYNAEDNQYYINGTINGVEYNDVSVHELGQMGVLSTKYVYYSKRVLTADEYKNKLYPYNANISYRALQDHIKINGSEVIKFEPIRIDLPPIQSTTKSYSR